MLPAWFEERPLRAFLPLQAVLLGVFPDLLPVWGDEQFTLDVVAAPWAGMLGTLAADIHPPLYFALVKLWAGALSGVDPTIAARLFSVLCALATTAALDLLWLRRTPRAQRLWFLALWTLSPLMLLYARMARSYALQALLAVIAMSAARVAAEQPSHKRLMAAAAGLAALLYTHYLPGLAMGFAVFVLLLRKSRRAAVETTAWTALLYLPWAPVLLDGLSKAASKDAYRLAPSALGELGVRLGYWGLTFTFGEAQTWVSLAAAGVLALVVGGLLLVQRPEVSVEQRMSLWAAPLGLLGTWRWAAFAFTPARLLFLAPAWLLTLASISAGRRGRLALAVLLAFYVAADAMYFGRVGLLNPGYEIPFASIADEIEETSGPKDTLVLVDAFNADPKPLLAALDSRYATAVAVGADFPERVSRELASRSPQTIWYLRSTRDVSPGAMHEAMEARLGGGFRLVETLRYVRYNGPQRTALALLTGGDAPTDHYQARRFERISD